jgi:hypothetical protein
MTFQQKVFGVLVSLFIFFVIVRFVKNGRLREEYSWLWLLTGCIILGLVLWYDALLFLTSLIGAVLPTTTLFIFAILFLVLIALHFAIRISALNNQVKNLAQQLSLLEMKIRK